MKYHRIYTIAAVFVLVIFVGFVGLVCFWPEPQIAGSAPVPQKADVKQALNSESHPAPINFAGLEDIANADVSESDGSGLFALDNSAEENSVIEIEPGEGQRVVFTPLAETGSKSNISSGQSDSSFSSASAASGGTVSSSGSSSSGGGSGGGSSSSGAGSGSSASSGTGNPPSSGTGGGGISLPEYTDPNHFLYFAGQRHRSHFKLVNDPYLKNYFAPNFVWDVKNFNDKEEFDRMTGLLRETNSNIILGYYMSACTTLNSSQDSFPPSRIPLEQCQPGWLLLKYNDEPLTWPNQEGRYFLDMRKAEVRSAVINRAIAQAQHYNLDALCFDNCYWGYGNEVVSKEEWTSAFMSFYQEAGIAASENDLLCVVNVATLSDEIADAFRTIAPYVDGLMTEMAFHPTVRSSVAVQAELQGYEDVLIQGKMVFLFPYSNNDLDFALRRIQPLGEEYGNIYLCTRGSIVPNDLYYLSSEIQSSQLME